MRPKNAEKQGGTSKQNRPSYLVKYAEKNGFLTFLLNVTAQVPNRCVQQVIVLVVLE